MLPYLNLKYTCGERGKDYRICAPARGSKGTSTIGCLRKDLIAFNLIVSVEEVDTLLKYLSSPEIRDKDGLIDMKKSSQT